MKACLNGRSGCLFLFVCFWFCLILSFYAAIDTAEFCVVLLYCKFTLARITLNDANDALCKLLHKKYVLFFLFVFSRS